MELSDLINKVEEAIEKMGITPSEARMEEAGQWILMRNELQIFIDAWIANEPNPWNYFKQESGDLSVFQVTVPFCYIPTLKRNEFLEELLTVNLNLYYGKFSVNTKDNMVALAFRKPGGTLVEQEIADVIDALCYYAEMTYHVLKEEFFLKRILVEPEAPQPN